MTRPRWEQFKDRAIVCGFVAFLVGAPIVVLFAPAMVLFDPPGNDTANEAIKGSALRVVFLWCAGWPIAFTKPGSGFNGTGPSRYRFFWTLGCVLLLVHIAIAFHAGHCWSHAAAWNHTKQVSGYGDGVFVNYAFTVVWLVDAVWVCVAFDSYLARPRWLHWGVHGFLAFVVFNAAVVFAGASSRVLFGAAFVTSVLLEWGAHRRSR